MQEGDGEDGKEASLEDIGNNNLPRRKWTALWLHASIMGGREFLYAVEIVLVTPIILQLGMPEKYYSFMWCFSPIIGVLIGPVLGSSSDRSTSRFGRRRPYILGLVIGAIIGLTFLIFSKDIAAALGGSSSEDRRLWGVVVGIVGAQLMDFCLDQTETPLRAYTLDVCNLKDQQRAFTLQTVFIGLGGALGFVVDGIDWESTALSSLFGSQIKVVYVFALFAYVTSTIFNLISIKEIPFSWNRPSTRSNATISTRVVASQIPHLTRSKSFQAIPCTDGSTQTLFDESKYARPTSLQLHYDTPSILVSLCENDDVKQTFQDAALSCLPTVHTKKPTSTFGRNSLLNFIRHKEFTARGRKNKPANNAKVYPGKETPEEPASTRQRLLVAGNSVMNMTEGKSEMKPDIASVVHESPPPIERCVKSGKDVVESKKSSQSEKKGGKQSTLASLKHLWLSIVTMPPQLKWLCLVQLLGFTGFETIMLWYTDLMGRVVYGGDPQAAWNSTELALYNDGVKMGCWGLVIYSIAMVLFSVFVERLRVFKRFSIRILYSFTFLLVVVAMLIMFFFTLQYVVLALTWTIGVSLAMLLTVPYVLVGKYHLDIKYLRRSPGNTKRGYGLDCGILACQMYAGNVISATLSSPVIHFAGTCRAMLLLTGACNLFAFFIAYWFVTYPGEGRSRCQSNVMVERSTETTDELRK